MHRKELDEAMKLLHLETASNYTIAPPRCFMSCSPAWVPGQTLQTGTASESEPHPSELAIGVFGGCVYIQAALAAAASLEIETCTGVTPNPRQSPLSIHSIQGVFTKPGLRDRPFVYGVHTIPGGRSFRTSLVVAAQPTQPSVNPNGPFQPSDAATRLNDPCFTAITTFKSAYTGRDEMQATLSAHERYADVLSAKQPDQWPPVPHIDLDQITKLYPTLDYGDFPMIDMHKVDMTAYNSQRAPADKRQLVYYRLMKPILKDQINSHIVCHAFAADRNGLNMLATHLDYGDFFGVAATLSYSFYVHVNGAEAVMDENEWWLLESSWPRASAGRCMMQVKVWSPSGKHVATAVQDGILGPKASPKI